MFLRSSAARLSAMTFLIVLRSSGSAEPALLHCDRIESSTSNSPANSANSVNISIDILEKTLRIFNGNGTVVDLKDGIPFDERGQRLVPSFEVSDLAMSISLHDNTGRLLSPNGVIAHPISA